MEHTVRTVGVLDKSVAILDAVADAPSPLSLGGLVTATGLTKATAHRLASALEGHGLLRRDPEGRYLLGGHLAALGRRAERWSVADVAGPALEELRRATGESVQLYRRDGDHRVCVVSLESSHELRTIVAQGARLALGVGSAGRILGGEGAEDAWLESVGERAPGVASVSAPVRHDGRVVAAVGISGPSERLGGRPGETHGVAVAGAARAIEQALAAGDSL